MTAGRTSPPAAGDPARAELLKLARREHVRVRFDRRARERGQPHVALLTSSGLAMARFDSSAKALRWLAGASR